MLEQLVHSFESRLKDLGRRLTEPGPREKLSEDFERLTLQLRERSTELSRCQHELAALKRRLRDIPPTAALLHARIETALRSRQPERAWGAALELDQLRQTLIVDQNECPRLEQRCWSLHFLVRQLERRLDRLHDRLSTF